MSFYVVLVDTDFKRSPGAEPALPKAVAHNLTRETAERLEAELTLNSVDGQPTGWVPYLHEYIEAHAKTEPENCLECKEIILEHCKQVLSLLQQETSKRKSD